MCDEMGGVLGSDALAAYNSIQIDCAASVLLRFQRMQ
jgi:hypothetical protein